MKKFENVSKPLMWFLALVLTTVVAGCGGSSGGTAVSSAKAITAYSINGVAGTINEGAKTIAVNLPFGTDVSALAATFTTTGANVKVGVALQVSGTTANNFATPVIYTVTAADATTVNYTVTVNVALASAKAITAYSINGVAGTINEGAKTIAVNLPSGTSVTALVATFTTTGASVKVGTTVQVSATTANDFTNPVVYIVTAADATTVNYTVTVNVALTSAKAITAYSINGVAGTIDEGAKTIAVTVPSVTDVTTLVATFTTTGSSVKVGTTLQTSGTTANDFTNSVVYIVTAADASTVNYTVTVTKSTSPTGIDLGTAGNFAILTKTGIGDVPASVITGNIGVSTTTGASIVVSCPELTGQMFTDDAEPSASAACLSADKTAAGIAVADMGTAYTNASAPTTPAGVGPFLELGAGTVTAQTLVPGVYTWAGNVNITGDITLSGSATDVWIFQIGGTLDTAKNITLAGNALAKNVFWRVADVVTLQGTSQFTGVILAKTNIVMINGATINGRLLAQTRVDLDHNTVTQPAP